MAHNTNTLAALRKYCNVLVGFIFSLLGWGGSFWSLMFFKHTGESVTSQIRLLTAQIPLKSLDTTWSVCFWQLVCTLETDIKRKKKNPTLKK